jgi:hypothetical protein
MACMVGEPTEGYIGRKLSAHGPVNPRGGTTARQTASDASRPHPPLVQLNVDLRVPFRLGAARLDIACPCATLQKAICVLA